MSTLNQAEVYPIPRPLLWIPICALAALYGMFTLGWMVYRVHLPAQMAQLGFSEQAAPTILLVEALLTLAVEPLAGAVSDRSQRLQNTRWPLISWGVGLSSLLFVTFAVASFAGFGAGLRWVMVALLLVWSVAMSGFRSPALALLRGYAPAARLPQAASLLTVAFGIAGAATPLASPAVLKLGSAPAFMLAAVLIVLSALWLRSSHPDIQIAAPAPSLQPVSLGRLAGIFGLGLTAMLAFRLAIETFPKLLKAQVPAVSPPLLVGLVFLSLAIAALPIGKLSLRQGNSRMMLIGVAATGLVLALMPLSHTAAGATLTAIGLGVGFSLILNGAIPFALMQVSAERAGLGIGLLFAGVAAATSLMLGFLGKSGVLSPAAAIGLGIAALLGVGLCVGLGSRAKFTE
jgi:MFS family permease